MAKRKLLITEVLESRVLFSGYTLTSLGSLSTPTSSTTGSQTSMVIDPQGNLFGTTYLGGANNDGSIIEVTGGQLTTVASFMGTDGVGPSDIAMDAAGNLFGVARFSGAGNIQSGYGTVFELAAGSTTIDPIVQFDASSLGTNPAALALDANDNIFVLATGGGANGGGAILEVAATTHVVTLVGSLTTPSQASPGSLTLANGNFYGTTFAGGASNDGTVFELPAGGNTVNIIGTFDGSTNGSEPEGTPFVDGAGNVFGTTNRGGSGALGEIYEIPVGTTTIGVRASFSDTTVFDALGKLISDSSGNLYGTTTQSHDGAGSVYKFSPSTGAITELATFNSTNGATPEAGLVADAQGNFFGATAGGGTNGTGVVFEASPTQGGGGGGGGSSTGITPTIAKSTLPADVVSGSKVRGAITLSITNSGATLNKGADTIALYASTDGVIDSGSTQIGSVGRKLTLKAGKSANISVPVKSLALPAGTYTILARTTDSSSNVIDATTGPTVTVAAAFVSLSGVVGAVSPAVVKAGKPFSFTITITNAGNVDSIGPATIAVGLTVDGVNLSIPLVTQTKSPRIKAGGKAVALRVRVKVPLDQVTGTFAPFVTFTQGTAGFSAVGATFAVA